MNNLSDWLNMNFSFSYRAAEERKKKKEEEGEAEEREREIVLNFAARQRGERKERAREREEKRGANEQDIHHKARRERVFRFPPLLHLLFHSSLARLSLIEDINYFTCRHLE